MQLYKTLGREPPAIVAEAKKVEEGQKREAERRGLEEEVEKAAMEAASPSDKEAPVGHASQQLSEL